MGHDLRHYARQTNVRLAIGFVVILLFVGDGLIYIFYGRSAAMMGMVCILAGLAPLTLIMLALWIIDRIVRAHHQD